MSRNMSPPLVRFITSADPFAMVNAGTRNTPGGSNGSATRRSTMTNPASANAPTAAAAIAAVPLPPAAITA